jgi:hypothetical protein
MTERAGSSRAARSSSDGGDPVAITSRAQRDEDLKQARRLIEASELKPGLRALDQARVSPRTRPLGRASSRSERATRRSEATKPAMLYAFRFGSLQAVAPIAGKRAGCEG